MAPSRRPVFRPPRLAILLLGMACASGACGKKGPPLPPLRVLPRPAQSVHIRQTGPDVVLEAAVSLTRTDGTPLGAGAVLRVLRMRPGPTLRPGSVSPRYLATVFQREAKPVVSLAGADLERAASAGRVTVHDAGALPASPGGVPSRYLYAIQVVDGTGQKSPFTVPVEIEVAPPPAAPVDLAIETAEGEVRLAWRSGEPERAGELFNVYRRPAAEGREPMVPLNHEPLKETSYVDRTFEYGVAYRYSVRALRAPPPPLRESPPCPEVEVKPMDVYPPQAPTGLAAAVEGTAIKLYWFPNGEPDLRGYRVYRREAEGDFVLLGQVDAAETSYADTAAARGVRYHYAVSAIDAASPPNESARSDEVSETVPADARPSPGS